MLAQHALCNIQDKALCNCKARCHLSAHAVAARSSRQLDAQALVKVSPRPVSQQGAVQVQQNCLDRLAI